MNSASGAGGPETAGQTRDFTTDNFPPLGGGASWQENQQNQYHRYQHGAKISTSLGRRQVLMIRRGRVDSRASTGLVQVLDTADATIGFARPHGRVAQHGLGWRRRSSAPGLSGGRPVNEWNCEPTAADERDMRNNNNLQGQLLYHRAARPLLTSSSLR